MLIGGATTSRTHTAVKIEPRYHAPVVHVLDASRAVGVASALLDQNGRDAFAAKVREEYETVRRERGDRQEKEARHPVEEARRHAPAIDWTAIPPPKPTFLGVRALGWGQGDQVITTPLSFVASANCLLFEGAEPVFCDIDLTTFNIATDQIEALITPRTVGILPVHLFGLCADMDAVRHVAERTGHWLLSRNYAEQAKKIFQEELTGTLQVIAKE